MVIVSVDRIEKVEGELRVLQNQSSRIIKIERHMRVIEQEIQTIAHMVSSKDALVEPDPTRGAATPDQIWSCKKCTARLGFYDPEEDVLRIRYKDFVTYVKIGVDGFVRVVCRSCSDINTAEWIEKEASGSIKQVNKRVQ
jgi:hypothetical protein